MTIRSPFEHFSDEAALVGRILAEYGELEFELGMLLGTVFNNPDVGIRTIFRTRGASRIQVADAILRPALTAVKLKNEYEASLGALRHSKTLRNQYAHAHWTGWRKLGSAGLFFADLDDAANKSEGEALIQFKHVDIALLTRQEKYMNYASEWLWYLESEYRVRVGRLPSHAYVAPKVIEKPPLHNPLEEHPIPPTEPGD
jgi:hypothetical protein